MHTLKERTYLSQDGKKVAQKGEKRRILLGAAGQLIPEAQAVALGLAEAPAIKEKHAEDFDKKVAEHKGGGEKSENKSGGKGAQDKGGKK